MRVLFSIAWSRTFVPPTGAYGQHQVHLIVQRSDWNLRSFIKLRYHVTETLRILRAARDFDVLVICTASVETILAGALRRLICPRTRIVCFDLLSPRRTWPARWLIPRLDAFACIRSGDIDNLVNRLHVAREKCEFVPFPTPELTDPPDITDGDYVYAGGSSYRDWPTLIEAVALSGCRAIFSAPHTLNIPATAKDSITVLPHQSPKDGRQRMARAAVAVVLLLETHRPNGPLILLDAMAMGKAVVTTLVNGTRDYVTDETAMLVPPADPHATANAIRQLMADPALRQRLGSAAAAHVRRQFTMSRTMAGIISLCERTLDQIAR